MKTDFDIIDSCGEYTPPSYQIEILFEDSDGQILDRFYPLRGDTEDYISCIGPMGALLDICYWLSHGGLIRSIILPTTVEFDFKSKELIL